jgi:tetratricopeptide (TPR) repeat protein
MRRGRLVRLLTFLTVGISFDGRAATIPDIVAKAKPAVVQVIASDANWSPIRTGTGFFVSADGDLLTNFHVIQGAAHISARTNKGAIFVFEKLISGSADSDVALLKFQATDVEYLRIGSSTEAVEGETVLVIGNPEGLQGTVSNGIISAFRDNRSYIQITAPISPGSSGSPVLDETGQVIGMATLVYKEGQNLNFAISAEVINVVVRSGLVQVAPASSLTRGPTPSATQEVPLTDADIKAIEYFASDYCSKGEDMYLNHNYEAAVKDYTEAIRLKPDFVKAYFGRGKAYRDLAKNPEAIADYTETIRLQPDDAEAFNKRAEAYFSEGQYDKAIADCSEVIRLKPDSADAYVERGCVYDNVFPLHQLPDAIADFSQAIRLKPRDAHTNLQAHSFRAFDYDRLGNYSEAIADYTEILRLNPDNDLFYFDRGQDYYRLGQYSRAIADFSEAIRLDPDLQVHLFNGGSYRYRGLAYTALREYEKAIADFDKVIQDEPGDASAYCDRAGAHFELAHYDQAIADWSKAIELKPHFSAYYYHRGQVFYALKRYNKAVDDYSEAIRLDSKYADAYKSRGKAYQAIGDLPRANADFKTAQQLESGKN